MTLAPRGFSAFGTAVASTTSSGVINVAGFFAEIVDTAGEISEERAKIDYTYSLSSGGGSVFRPGDIITTGDYELTLVHNCQKAVPWGQEETIVVTLPKRGTDNVAATKTFLGFLTKHVTSLPFKDKMLTKCTLCVTGIVAHAASTL